MTTITATHENGSKIQIKRENKDVERTVKLMRECGYVKIEVVEE